MVNNQTPSPQGAMPTQSENIKQQLRSLGLSRIALRSMESRYLPHIIHPGEKILGVVYGMAKDGFAMLVATDRRAIFLDKKPLFVNEDEINYSVVSGVSHSRAGPGSTVTLHTRIKDFTIQTFNVRCVTGFVEAIEKRCLENVLHQENHYDYNP